MQSAFIFDDLSSGDTFTLPYGVKKKARFRTNEGYLSVQMGKTAVNQVAINNTQMLISIPFEFPIIDGKSPCTFKVLGGTSTRIDVFIEEIGGEGDPDYFNK